MSIELWKSRNHLKYAIRHFFDKQGYTEVDTPIAVRCPGTEKYLDYFPTTWVDHKNCEHPLWLRSSPELHMKQIISFGGEKIYQIAPCFRNHGELSNWHHPEFTMLEWYEVGITYEGFIEQTIQLLRSTYSEMKEKVRCADLDFLFKPVNRFTLKEAFSEFVDVDLFDNDPELAKKTRAAGVRSVNASDDFETAFFKTLLERIEPEFKRMQAVVLYDYPPSQAALAKVENGVARRFELYVHGVELSNGFYELVDAKENRLRVKETNEFRKSIGKSVPSEDEDFYLALERNIPSCAGNALGFDRWLALLQGATSLDASVGFRGQQPYSLA